MAIEVLRDVLRGGKSAFDETVTQAAVEAALGVNPLAYVQSRGLNLVTNGTGLLGNNTNFPSCVFDSSEAFSAAGSFKKTSTSITVQSSELVPVTASERYELSAYLKWIGDVQPRHYVGLAFYDVDKQQIIPSYHRFATGSNTTLAQPLKPGDTKIYLSSSANWYAGSKAVWRRLGIFGFKNNGGYTYPGWSYTRRIVINAWAENGIDFVNHVVNLSAPLPGSAGNPDAPDGAWPIGHPVANNQDSASFKYIAAANVLTPTEWTQYKGTIEGIDLSGTNQTGKFPPGTAYAKIVFLLNYGVATEQTTLFSNVDLRLAPRYSKITINHENQNPVTMLAVNGDAGPYNDDGGNCGVASKRWSQIYAVSGTINTSDARLKTQVRPLEQGELAAAMALSREIGIFQWLNALAHKGDAARLHTGVTVQRVIEIMQAHGLDPMRYGMVCYDQWDARTVEHPAEIGEDADGREIELAPARTEVVQEAGDRYSLRYDQLLAFAVRGLAERIARLEGQNDSA